MKSTPRWVRVMLIAMTAAAASWPGTRAIAQTEPADAALRDRVLQLVERLDAPAPEARDEAQSRLIKLGAKVLPLLPDPAGITSQERKQRLERIRRAINAASEEVKTGAARVTIQAKGIRLTEALQQITDIVLG